MDQDLLQRCAQLRLGRNNLFDLVRLYAAVQVLLVHGQAHLKLQWPTWLMQCFSCQECHSSFRSVAFW